MLAEPFLSRFAPAHTRHTTGIERPWCVESLPSHISKMVVSTVSGGGPGQEHLPEWRRQNNLDIDLAPDLPLVMADRRRIV